ncbi:MAG: nucleoside phosphorylase [Clostridia bacterium]|nr:nucleoside phosphorylase [Clostridia bacterium]
MITDSFDDKSPAKINPNTKSKRLKCDAVIITFSNKIEESVLHNFNTEKIGEMKCVSGTVSVYKIEENGRVFVFYKTWIGAPATVGFLEDLSEIIETKNIVIFGGAGTLDKTIKKGTIMIPTESYRDEGTSYHYAKPQNYIQIKNHKIVEKFIKNSNISCVCGKNWTTDAFFRETENNIKKRKSDGCISVDMECSSVQAFCDFRGYELYYFLTSGDLLDVPEWNSRNKDDSKNGGQHDATHFDIALKLALFVTEN